MINVEFKEIPIQTGKNAETENAPSVRLFQLLSSVVL